MADWLNTSKIIYPTSEKPCHKLGWCPYGKLIEAFPLHRQSFSCKAHVHNCPVFYLRGDFSEQGRGDALSLALGRG